MVACCWLTWTASTSPIVMTPASPRSLTAGRWRMRLSVIMAAHASARVSGAQAGTGVVMTSATLVAAGSRRCATTRRRMSRSVKMPTSRPPSVTTSPPMPRSLMSSAAFSTVSPGFTEMTSLPFLARISWTVGTLPPPGWASSRYYRGTGADATLSGPPEARCHHGAGSDQRRPARCARPPDRRRARDRRRPHGARRLLPGARASHLDRVRGDDVRGHHPRDGLIQGRNRSGRVPAVDPVGARRLPANRSHGVMGPVGGDLRGGGRLPDGTDAAVPDQRPVGGEYGAGLDLARLTG